MLILVATLSLGLSPALPAPLDSTDPPAPSEVTQEAPRERLIPVAGTTVKLLLSSERSAEGVPVDHYRIALDGETFSRPRPVDPEILLRWGEFDPLVAAPDHSTTPLADAGQLHIVQFVTQSLEAFRQQLSAMGADVSRPLPNQAHVVRMDEAVAEAVAALPWVRWVGSYHPIYRLEPFVAEQLGTGQLRPARYRVQVLERGAAQKQLVADRLVALGGSIDELYPGGFLFDATLDEALLTQVVTWDEVLWVDRWSPPEEDMDLVRLTGGANFIETTLGYTGQGVRAEVCDGNVLATHADFQSDPIIFHGPHDGDDSHGSSTTGVVFGDGASDPVSRGLMPNGQPVFADYAYLTDRYTHTAQLVQAPYYCVFQSNSWGSNRTSYYTSDSFEMDDIIFLNDIVICQSQSNAGDTESRPQAWAKNVVAVGGIRHLDTLTTADDSWSGGASIGPAADGRIKPDLYYWYDNVWTVADYGHRNFSGTSAATPCVAGYFGLFFQMWHNGIWPGYGGAATVFDSRPKSTTAKAMIINHAWCYPFSGTSHDLTRVHQGWGRPDLQRIYEMVDKTFIINEEVVLQNLQTASYDLQVEAGEPELRATLVYLDPAGTTSSSLHRINDLSLRVTSPSGQVYWGNNGLLAGNWSTAGGSSNTKDTVENVFVENPAAGSWSIDVIADAIVQDSHVETGAVDADFALVVSGVVGQGCADPHNFCTTSPNSVGSGATMIWTGTPSITAADLQLVAVGCPSHQFGVFYYGAAEISLPFGEGIRCVGSGGLGTYRFAPFQTDAFGGAFMLIDYTSPPAGSGPGTLYAGEEWKFQFWYRDPAGGGTAFNLSDGLSIMFCP